MSMSRGILVPLDGHRSSESALPVAIERARISGAGLYLLDVVSAPPRGAEALPQHRAAVQKAERYLAAMRRQIADEVDVEVSSAVWSGSPAAAIVKAADLIDAQLIVIARGGRTGSPRKVVGSVVERVLQATRRPVLVVSPADATVAPAAGVAAPLPDNGAPPVPRPLAAAAPETYGDVLRHVGECERAVLRVVTTIQQAAKSLERWQAVSVTHAGAGFPKEVTMMGRVIEGASWPTGRELAETLAAWHEAAEAARVAWSRVPGAERGTLTPPP
jgi:nucleotide-binding universal stress UspA family protein